MKKMFLALIAVLPFIAGCWPFSKEQPKPEVTENMTPAEEPASTHSEKEMSEEASQNQEAESDEETENEK